MTAVKSEVKIVKASGSVEPFDPNVITTECVEAGIEFFTAADVALEVSKHIHDGISTKEIQDSMLKILYQKNPAAAERYKRFHSMQVRTSRNTIEPFNRKKISNSLLKETNLPRELAESVAKESEEELRKLKLDFISAPLIREVVNVKLLEHGLEEARADYTRLGMPVYDAAQLIEAGEKKKDSETLRRLMADNILKEYTLLKVLPRHIADGHMRGELHIHGLEYFAAGPYSTVQDVRTYLRGMTVDAGSSIYVTGPAKNAEEAVFYSAKALASRADFSLENCFDFFNVYLAPYMRGVEYQRMKQLARFYVYESQAAVGSEIRIEYGCPQALRDIEAVLPGGEAKNATYGDFSEEATAFGRALAEVYYEGDHIRTPFSFPRIAYKIRKENIGREYEEFIASAHAAAARSSAPKFINLREYAEEPSSGVLQIVTINLPRIAYEAGGDENKLYEILNERLSSVREVMMIKRDILSQRIKQGLSSPKDVEWLDELVHSIGYLGLNEMAKAHTGKELHEDASSLKFGLDVVKYIAGVAERWSEENGLKWRVAQPPSESAPYRLAKLDYRQFSNKVAAWRINANALRYTNSSQLREGAKVSLDEKIRIESTFHPFNTGGITLEVQVEKDRAKRLIELSKKIEKTKIRSWSYRVSRC